jgi:hypothetical protein
MSVYGSDPQKDAEHRAYARGYAAGKKAQPRETRIVPEPTIPPLIIEPKAAGQLSLMQRMKINAVLVAHYTDSIRTHAEWLERDRKQQANAMRNLEGLLTEVEAVATDPFAASAKAKDDAAPEACSRCEGCGAPLYPEDTYAVDENGVVGCFAVMTDPPVEGRPCYASRVGKPDANLASADTRPEGGDSTEIEAPFTSGAVPKADAQGPSHD